MNQQHIQRSFFYVMLLIIIISLIFPLQDKLVSHKPVIKNGVLDLKSTAINLAEPIKLNGQWEFYAGRLLTPEDFQEQSPSGQTIQEVPSDWRSYHIHEQRFPAFGAATYRLKVLLPQNLEHLYYGIKTPCIPAATRIFVNSQQVLTCGIPGYTLQSTQQKYHADTTYFTIDQDEITILVQVANFTYAKSGINSSIYLGSQAAIDSLRIRHVIIDISLISSMFIMAIFFFGIGMQRNNKPEILFFALYCLFSALHYSTYSEAILNYLFPSISANFSAKILVLSLTLSLFSLYKFVYYTFNASFKQSILRIIDGIALCCVLLILFTEFYLSSYAGVINIIGNLFVLLIMLFIIIKQLYQNIEGRYYIYTALICCICLFFISFIENILHWDLRFIPIFQPIFILSLALYMSEKYENAYKTIENLNKDLISLNKLKDDLLAKETAFLQAQIKPHFLYNALNTISSFCYTSPAKAGELLSALGTFLRSLFDHSNFSTFITIEKELKLVSAYAAIEKARFGDLLEVSYNIDPCSLDYCILPFSIQPIVENAIHHGIMKNAQGGNVTVNIWLAKERLFIEVVDNGVGLSLLQISSIEDANHKSQGVGLTNINQRLLSFYGTKLVISSTVGQTSVSFDIPTVLY